MLLQGLTNQGIQHLQSCTYVPQDQLCLCHALTIIGVVFIYVGGIFHYTFTPMAIYVLVGIWSCQHSLSICLNLSCPRLLPCSLYLPSQYLTIFFWLFLVVLFPFVSLNLPPLGYPLFSYKHGLRTLVSQLSHVLLCHCPCVVFLSHNCVVFSIPIVIYQAKYVYQAW